MVKQPPARPLPIYQSKHNVVRYYLANTLFSTPAEAKSYRADTLNAEKVWLPELLMQSFLHVDDAHTFRTGTSMALAAADRDVYRIDRLGKRLS